MAAQISLHTLVSFVIVSYNHLHHIVVAVQDLANTSEMRNCPSAGQGMEIQSKAIWMSIKQMKGKMGRRTSVKSEN